MGPTIALFPNRHDTQVTLRIAHEAPDKHHPDIPLLEITNYILGGNSLTSRLGVRIRDRRGLVYGITTYLRARNHGGWWFLEAKMSPENVGEVLVSAIAEIQRMRHSTVSQTELNDARSYYLGTRLLQIENQLDILKVLGNEVELGLPLDHFDRYPSQIIPISRADVLRAARRYFHPERSIIAVGGPITAEELVNSFEKARQARGLTFDFDIREQAIEVIR